MDAKKLKQLIKDDPGVAAASKLSNRPRWDKRMTMARRGLRSLAVAVAIPLSLTLINIYLSCWNRHGYGILKKPFWFRPLWLLHVTSMASSFLTGLSAWLVWAEGEFHKNPRALSLYLAQLQLGLVWEMVVFRIGASWAGLVVCLATFGSLAGCSKVFREMNPIAGDLFKPCLAFAWLGAFATWIRWILIFFN